VIICTSLTRDFLPTSWGYFTPTVVDIFTFFGTFGIFSVLFLLFVRFLPLMAIAEIKAVTPQADVHVGHDQEFTGHGDPVIQEVKHSAS
jgi:molybdopterin-containing oxidoreductase family membrane subunit